MDTLQIMRHEVKNYVDKADAKIVKMMHAMLEAEADDDWWDSMPDAIKESVEIALKESEKGIVIPHSEIQKRYKKWIAK